MPSPDAPQEARIFDQFQESVALFDRTECFIYANPAFSKVLGKPVSELLGRRLWEVSGEPASGPLCSALRRVLTTGVSERLEHVSEAWGGRLESRLYTTPSGVCLISTHLCTGAETEFDRLASMIQQSPAAIAVIKAPGWEFELSNAKNDELAGRGPLVGRNVYEAMPELVSQGFAHLLDLIYRTHETFDDVEVKLSVGSAEEPREIYLNGTYQPILNAEGKVDRIAAFVHDVTEKVKARQRIEALADELAVSEARARRLQDSGVIGVVFWTRSGQVVDANDAFLTMVGYTRDELVSGRVSWTEMTPPEFAHLDAKAFSEMEQSGICTPFEKVYVGKDGRRIPILIGLAFWKNSTDSGVAWIVDISARRAAEAERDSLLERERLARAQAEQANRSKDDFLAMVSHELRTPLNAMLGWARMLSAGPPDDARIKRGLEVIERNAIAQAQLIEDLLDVSRIVHGKLRLEIASVDVCSVVEAAVDSVRPIFEAKGIRLTVDLEPTPERILGDAHRLQQVVWNLLSNSSKFTPKGGQVHVALHRMGSRVELSVADNGRGIATSALPFVFDRFRQADASITRAYGGLGLGLSIARHLVELHGGTIEASSEGEGKGARFTLILGAGAMPEEPPRAAVEPPPQSASLTGPQSELVGLRVLVVDDEQDARELTSTILSQLGAKVVAAASASDAMRILREEPLDVLLSDIGMPEQDGYQLIRNVRQMSTSAARIPAAALTAFTRNEERRQAMLAGYHLHIAKPVEPSELTAAVACLARMARPGP